MKLLRNHGNCAGVVTDGQVITRSYSLRYHGDQLNTGHHVLRVIKLMMVYGV